MLLTISLIIIFVILYFVITRGVVVLVALPYALIKGWKNLWNTKYRWLLIANAIIFSFLALIIFIALATS